MNIQPIVQSGITTQNNQHNQAEQAPLHKYRNPNYLMDAKRDLLFIFQMIYSNMLRNVVKERHY